MTTPNTSISALAVSNINQELNYANSTPRAFNDGIFRNLTGLQSRTVANTSINISELSGKTAFGGILADTLTVIQKTNLLRQSDNFNGSTWTKAQSTVGADATTAPDGTNTADLLKLAISGSYCLVDASSVSLVPGQFTASVFAKVGPGVNYLALSIGSSRLYGVFDLVNGAVLYQVANGVDFSSPVARIESVGNGYYRCSIAGNLLVGQNCVVRVALSDGSNTYAANITGTPGVTGLYIWGAQLEAGDRPSPYIPTGAAIASAYNYTATIYGVDDHVIQLSANTDMYSPSVTWGSSVVLGSNASLVQSGKTAQLSIKGVLNSNVYSTLLVTSDLSYDGHAIGSASAYVTFQINTLPSLLAVTGNTSVNNATFAPTTSSTVLTATANVPNSAFTFVVTPTDAGVYVSGNTVTLTSTALSSGVDNNRSYSVRTLLYQANTLISSNTTVVNVRATYLVPDIVLSVPATSNNNFANTGTVRSSLTITGTHNVASANVAWSATKVSGDDAVLTVASDNGSANLHVNVASGVFGTKKSIYDVTATVQYSNGQVVTSKTQRLTLRTGAYGMSFNPASNTTSSGYVAQTAVATSTVTYQAGTLSWDILRIDGSVADVSNSVGVSTGTASLQLSRSGVGSSNSVYRMNPVLVFDGTIMANVESFVKVTAQQNAYSFSLAGASSNTRLGAAPVSTTIVTTGTHDVVGGTVTWSKSSSAATLSSNTSSATTTFTNNTIGTDTFTLTGTLLDSQGRTVASLSKSLTQRCFNPNIQWVGSNNFSTIGYDNQTATASINATARAGADTFTVTAVKLVGSDLEFSVTGNTSLEMVSLVASQNTIGTDEGLYRLTANVTWFGVSNTSTYDVRVSATKDTAGLTLTGSGETKSSYNSPVVANGTFAASHSIPDGTVTWTRTINSGTVTDTPVSNATNYVFRTSRTAVGTSAANVTVTATLRDGSGTFIDQKSNTVSTSATVSNPSLVLNGPTSNVISNTFHASSSITLTPSVAAGLSGHNFTFSATPVTGSANISSNSTAIVLSNVFDGAGSLSGTYDVVCNVVLNGQIIDTTTKRVTVTATCPAPTYNFVGDDDSNGSFNFPVNSYATVDAYSSPSGAVISWSWVKVSGPTANLYTENSDARFVVNGQQSNIGSVASVYDVTATYRTPNGTLLTTRTARVTATSNRYDPALTWDYDGSTGSNTVSGFGSTISTSISLHAGSNTSLVGESYRITSIKVGGNKTSTVTTSNSAGTATVTLSNSRTGDGTNQKTSEYDVSVDVLFNSQVIAGPTTRRVSLTATPNVIQTPDLYASRDGYPTATASVMVKSDGQTYSTDYTTNIIGAWMVPFSSADVANYQVKFTMTDGSGAIGNFNTWIDITSNPSISLTARSPSKFGGDDQFMNAGGTYQIRNKNTLTVESTGSWGISATAP